MDRHVNFEWDLAKAERNLHKHRISFEDAIAIFADSQCATIDTIRAEDEESRSKAVGFIGNRLYTVVFVMRGNVCRLISARRSNRREEHGYASRNDRSRRST